MLASETYEVPLNRPWERSFLINFSWLVSYILRRVALPRGRCVRSSRGAFLLAPCPILSFVRFACVG
jgi:hypothetical protein